MRRAPLLMTFTLGVGLLCSSLGARAQQPQEDEPSVALPAFEFHSGFWINLHHFLYLQGRLRNTRPVSAANPSTADDAPPPPEFGGLVSTDGLTPDQQKAWNSAVSAYAKDWSSRDLLRNSEMVLANNRLAEEEDCPDLNGKPGTLCAAGLKPDLVAALNLAAPVYRAKWWPQQDRDNRAWIAGVAPLVRRFGGDLSSRLTDAYQRHWPAGPLRIDVVWYAGSLGSYTSLDPVHITISSRDSRNQGVAALEVLYHEASHMLAESVDKAIVAECRSRGVPIPRDLWHAVVYYTTGELVRRVLAANGASAGVGGSAATGGYMPYAQRNGLYERGWNNYQQVLERYWQPYLDGQIQFDTAISRMVAAL